MNTRQERPPNEQGPTEEEEQNTQRIPEAPIIHDDPEVQETYNRFIEAAQKVQSVIHGFLKKFQSQ